MSDARILGTIALAFATSASACKDKQVVSDSQSSGLRTQGNQQRLGAQAATAAQPKPEDDGAKAPAQPTGQPAFEFKGVGRHLVRTIGAFTIATAPRYFGPDTLYTLINGGADAYVSLGLKEMVTADYTAPNRAKLTITVEIYDMGSAKSALARFSKFLKAQQDPGSAGKGLPDSLRGRGLLGGASVSFWKQNYLVNAILMDESEAAKNESMTAEGALLLPMFAKTIDDAL